MMTNDATLVGASLFPHVVVRAGGQVIQEIELRAELTVGRAEDNSLALADPKVSRHHARIDREGTSFVLTDLGSANGTRVDGVRVTGPHPLQHGERIAIGDAELTYLEPGRSLEDTIVAAGPPAAMRAAPQAQPTRTAAPPARAAAPVSVSQGRSLGLAIGVGLIGVVLILAIVLVGIYLLNPGVFERIGLVGRATPTASVVVAGPTSPGEVTTPAAPSPSAAAPTSTTGAIEPQEMNDLLTQAEALVRRSKFEDATAIYEDLVQRAPAEPRPEIGWAWALLLDDEAGQALAHAQKAMELDPTNSDAAAVLARAYLDTGDKAQGLAMAQQAVQLSSGSSEAHAVLAEAYMVNGQIQSAVDEADLALVQDINNADAHRIRGWLYHVAENDMGRAAGELQSAAGLQPELWLRRYDLGMLLLEAEDYTTAILAFQDALGIRPKAMTYTGIGQAYYELGQYDQARASAQQALSAGAQDADTYALLAATYAKQGRCDEAKTYYEQALALDATQPLALEAQNICQGAGSSPSAPPPTTALASEAAPASSPAATAAVPAATPVPTKASAPAAPVSGRIAFPVWNPGTHTYDSYVAKADGSGRHLVVDGMHQPALSPDGKWLAVNGEKRDYMNMYIVQPDGSGLKKITDFIEDSLPCWSPDSKGFVLATTRDQPGHPQRIYVVDEVPFTGHIQPGRVLAAPSGPVQGDYPTWTPDNQVVYKGCDYTVLPQACGLFVIPVAGGDFKRLTDNGNDTAPAASGGRIAFMSNRDGNWEVYIINDDGSGLKRLTNNAANDGLPAWSPDGKTIAFVSDQGGAWAIWAMSPDGSNRRKLFEIGGGGLASAWQQERISWGP
jgi:TolB protein